MVQIGGELGPCVQQAAALRDRPLQFEVGRARARKVERGVGRPRVFGDVEQDLRGGKPPRGIGLGVGQVAQAIDGLQRRGPGQLGEVDEIQRVARSRAQRRRRQSRRETIPERVRRVRGLDAHVGDARGEEKADAQKHDEAHKIAHPCRATDDWNDRPA